MVYWERYDDVYAVIDCPVCGHKTLNCYWICDWCGWEAQPNLLSEDEQSDANGDLSINEYRRRWEAGGRQISYPEGVEDPDWKVIDGRVYLRQSDREDE